MSRFLINVINNEFTRHQDRQSSAETGGQVRSDQWPGMRKVIRKDFNRSAGQYDLNGSSLPVVRARNEHKVVENTSAEQDD